MLRVTRSHSAASAAAMLALAATLLSACGVADRSAVQLAAVPTPVSPIAVSAPGDLLGRLLKCRIEHNEPSLLTTSASRER